MEREVLVVIGVGGMGEIIARRQGPGRQVVVADFNTDTLERVAERLRGDGFAVTAQQVDVSEAASVLHIHPNTLRYRLRRIEAICGLDLSDPAARFAAQLQLRLFPPVRSA